MHVYQTSRPTSQFFPLAHSQSQWNDPPPYTPIGGVGVAQVCSGPRVTYEKKIVFNVFKIFVKIFSLEYKGQYTPPTPLSVCLPSADRDSTVELSRVGCAYGIRNYWRQSRRVWTNRPIAKSSCFMSLVLTCRRELVANSVHIADADATQLDSWVASVCIGL